MKVIIDKMFDYELEVVEIEKQIFAKPTQREIYFNFMDLSFQLFSGEFDETHVIATQRMNELRKNYDRKACLNCHQREIVIDFFRFCIRKENMLSKYLDKDFAGFDNTQDLTNNGSGNILKNELVVKQRVTHT